MTILRIYPPVSNIVKYAFILLVFIGTPLTSNGQFWTEMKLFL